jgi:peroxiredoxin Q/BCP
LIAVGQHAPDFSAAASDGRTITLSAMRGRAVVLYFYPKSFTPGCTTEARLFRDNHHEIQALGAEVIGVSIDDLETQCRFAATHRLGFPLCTDRNRAISRAYGVLWPVVPVDKRVTFIIDEEGVVRAVFRHEFQVVKHLDDVVHFLKARRK